MVYKAWTTTETKYLREKHRVIPVLEIAKNLGRSFHSVRLQIAKMGLNSVNFWKESEDKQLLHMLGKGFSRQKIAYALGRSYNSVRTRTMILKRRRADEQRLENV